MKTIKLLASDDETIEVDLKLAQMSETIDAMIKTLGASKANSNAALPLPNISGSILKMIFKWAKHHQNDPPERADESSPFEEVPAWDKEFLNVELHTLIELIIAVDFLNIRGLMRSCCKTIADLMRGKSAEEIRLIFGITNDLNDQPPPPTAMPETIQPARVTNKSTSSSITNTGAVSSSQIVTKSHGECVSSLDIIKGKSNTNKPNK